MFAIPGFLFPCIVCHTLILLHIPYINALLRACFSHSVVWLILCWFRSVAFTFVVDIDGFQHGSDTFSIKCLAISCNQTRTMFSRLFDTMTLLPTVMQAALKMYQYQTHHHGLALAYPGLPPSMAGTIIQHGIQL